MVSWLLHSLITVNVFLAVIDPLTEWIKMTFLQTFCGILAKNHANDDG